MQNYYHPISRAHMQPESRWIHIRMGIRCTVAAAPSCSDAAISLKHDSRGSSSKQISRFTEEYAPVVENHNGRHPLLSKTNIESIMGRELTQEEFEFSHAVLDHLATRLLTRNAPPRKDGRPHQCSLAAAQALHRRVERSDQDVIRELIEQSRLLSVLAAPGCAIQAEPRNTTSALRKSATA